MKAHHPRSIFVGRGEVDRMPSDGMSWDLLVTRNPDPDEDLEEFMPCPVSDLPEPWQADKVNDVCSYLQLLVRSATKIAQEDPALCEEFEERAAILVTAVELLQEAKTRIARLRYSVTSLADAARMSISYQRDLIAKDKEIVSTLDAKLQDARFCAWQQGYDDGKWAVFNGEQKNPYGGT